jgi:predicted Fe-Mo cluster-binding NifX family protein
MHFGKTPYFTFIKLEDGKIKDIEVIESLGKHRGGANTPAEIIADSNTNVLICGNLGSKAVLMLREKDIMVFSGASGKVKDALNRWKQGLLQPADENSCNEKNY